MKDEQDRARGAGNDPRAHAQMGYLLRQVYGTVITEPVPDRFSALLEQLSEKIPGVTEPSSLAHSETVAQPAAGQSAAEKEAP